MPYVLTMPVTGADGDLEKLVELAVLAEEAGWDGIALEDYIVFWAEGDRHYQMAETMFMPRPLQQPRIPMWVGGGWPRKAPFRRAARWDGAIPFKINPDGAYDRVTPEDIRAIREFIAAERNTERPFDLVTEGRTLGDDPARARAIVRPYAEAGLTWWFDYVGPVFGDYSAMRQRIEQGPPRIEEQ